MNDEPSNRDVMRAVTVWVILQLIAMGLVVARVQFWNNSNLGDHSALAIVTAIQIVGASMLVGVLTPDLRAALFIVLASIPFVHLAGVLSAASINETLRSGAQTVLWLATLYAWSTVTRSAAARALLSAAATSISLGTLLLNYLGLEFSASGRALACDRLLAMTVLCAISLLFALLRANLSTKMVDNPIDVW